MMFLLFAAAFLGLGIGAWVTFVLVERRRSEVSSARKELERSAARTSELAKEVHSRLEKATRREEELRIASLALQQERARHAEAIELANAALEEDRARRHEEIRAASAELEKARALFERRSVTLGELERENRLLKRDLLALDVHVRKCELDGVARDEVQRAIDQRSRELAQRYLLDTEKWVGATLNANNFAASKQRLVKAIEWCRGIGFDVPEAQEAELLRRLQADYERAVRIALEREEQARIKAQIREEQAREREIQRELDAVARERAAIEAAIKRVMADTTRSHAEELAQLNARLAEAEERGQRAVSQAQLTKAGNIYVISNIGAFGESVFKIGMTRRLDPYERICELGDASVPFPFDVHMMTACQDAPALECALHQEFHKCRVNKVNPRKEFFRVDLERVRQFVEARHGEVRFVADAEALQYRQSVTMSDEDQEYIEKVFEEAESRVAATDVDD